MDTSDHLFVGGYFSKAGNNVSPFIAMANLSSTPTGGYIQNIQTQPGTVTLDFLGVPPVKYGVQRASDVRFTANITTLITTNAPSPAGVFRYTDPNPLSSTAYYRLVKQ